MGAHFAWCCTLLSVLAALVAEPIVAEETPGRYILSYPEADRFCPPVDGFFEEVQRTVDRVGYHTFRHQPNGGYGLPVVDKVGDAHLLHLGADVGFYRVGEPVYAVANGVVRISQGPPKEDATKKKQKPATKLEWGNFIVLEHRLPNDKYATTIYGHLANERLVNVGDVVQAGQQIGTIGTTRVNGGYKPHLHLGVRDGRMAAVGRKLLVMTMDGKPAQPEIAELRGDNIVLTGAKDLPEQLQIGLDGRKFQLSKHDDKAELNAAFLSYVPSPEFMIVGYGLSTDGWLDPIAFLKSHGADTNPAPFGPSKRRSQRRGPAGAIRHDGVAAAKESAERQAEEER
jgi:murein DD-endopeptidase MepM/ murein hydrolase activator NlpD